jgi:hypothetical protein
MKKANKTKSPIKTPPLRNPGESTEQESQRIADNVIGTYALPALCFTAFALMEWFKYFTDTPPMPRLVTAIAVVFIGLTAIKILRARPIIKAYLQGAKGEKAVGQYLDDLRADGAKVLHDIPGEGFNIDHVVIHSSGIFAIETKTYSKPSKGPCELVFDGETVSRFGKELIKNPVTQASAAANWLADKLEESTGKKWPVKPVVLFPGWYVKPSNQAKNSQVWVLNPKALPAFMANRPQELQPDQIAMVNSHLSRYVRSLDTYRDTAL